MARKRPRSEVAAAVDIGSYSVHLLVATVRGHVLEARHDESAFLGLGRAIDQTGELGVARPQLVETISTFVMQAWSLGASTITIVGTDPLRRAADAGSAVGEIAASTGVNVAVLGHEEEAFVALIGVQAGRPILRETAVVDVGGGSTEVLVVGPAREPVAAGLPLGATRLTGMLVRNDPPTRAEVVALLGHSLTAMAAAPDVLPTELIAVGGTARSLLRVGPRLANRSLTRRRIRRALELMASAPAEVTAERYGIRLSRAHVLAAGASILLGALDRYRLTRLRVAAGGLREGLLLAASRAGSDWRSELHALARGWDR
jgi:exopolyphosphatase / guanosine-5'-triphosphate,3'-diphosphate pyrophosphatase